MKKLLASLSCLALLVSEGALAQNQVINDSLVKNLDCSTLTKDTVLAQIQPDAFSDGHQLSNSNMDDKIGLSDCWSLAHAQRIYFYFARFSPQIYSKDAYAPQLQSLLNMFSGSQTPGVFPVYDSGQPYFSGTQNVSAALALLPDKQFFKAIDSYQVHRFSNPLNFHFILGSRDRAKSDNAATFAQIQADVAKNRMPMVILRPSRTWQHVVLIRGLQQNTADGSYSMSVYDSNVGGGWEALMYSPTQQEFYGGDVTAEGSGDTDSPVGVFLVDEGDMDSIQSTLFSYYKNLCGR